MTCISHHSFAKFRILALTGTTTSTSGSVTSPLSQLDLETEKQE